MRWRPTLMVLLAFGVAGTGLLIGRRHAQPWEAAVAWAAEKAGQEKKPAGPPPLVVSKDAPRLSDEPQQPAAPATGPVANNESCYCCHANYREESFVVYHARANVGCIECHGESLAHRNDEDNITPPDVMIPPEKIEKNCQKCHDTHDAPPAKVIAMWQERCASRSSPKELLCTDCHGEHRLGARTVSWDKRTGKLTGRKDGAERIRPTSAPTKSPEPVEEMR